MKKILFLLIMFYQYFVVSGQNNSIPILTNNQRISITNASNGFIVFESTSNTYFLYQTSCNCWQKLQNKNTNYNGYKVDSLNDNQKITIGSPEGFTSFDKDGTILFNKTATVFEDLTIPVTSTKLQGSKPPTFDIVKNNGNNSFGVFTYWFDYDSDEELFFTVQIPHKRKINSDIYPHIHWTTPTKLNGKKVKWGMEYTTANIGNYFKNTVFISSSDILNVISNDSAYQHLITELGTISGKNIGISNMFICRVFRDADSEKDTYEEEVGLLQIDFHYEIDAIGSREEYEK